LTPTGNDNKWWEQTGEEKRSGPKYSSKITKGKPLSKTSSSSSSSTSNSYSSTSKPTEETREPEPVQESKNEEVTVTITKTTITTTTPIEPVKFVDEIKKVDVVRSSKFRHIVTKGTKKDACYDGLRVGLSASQSTIKANRTFFCVPWQGSGGPLAIIPVKKTGRQIDVPFLECGSDCLDFDFNPFDDHVLASVTERAHVQIWKIPQDGLKATTKTPASILKGHNKRTTTVSFHPLASNIVISAASDAVKLWDVSEEKEKISLRGSDDIVQSITWNFNGSIMATSSKDRTMRFYDARNNTDPQKSVVAHEGVKGFHATWLGNTHYLSTCGQGKGADRQIRLWDFRKIDSPLSTTVIDTGAGIVVPFYDIDNHVLFCCGRGDGGVKMFELMPESSESHFLTEYKTQIPNSGMAVMPKPTVDVRNVEIAHFFKLCGDYVEPLSFRVPRTRMEFFQDDVFPLTVDTQKPALSSSEWFSGTTKDPIMINLRPSDMPVLSENPLDRKVQKYVFESEQIKSDSGLTKEKMIAKYSEQIGSSKGEILEQDKQQGATSEEWNE